MKRNFILTALLSLALIVVGGCAEKLHKPTTAGNAGTTALVAYAVAGFSAGKYFALPLCATPPVYPCKTQSINDRLLLADTAAYNAAKAADQAGGAAAKVKADNANKELAKLTAAPEVKTQVDLVTAGDTP